eukprot:XP_024456658.1 bidirectional sugar transporter SWEET16 isoform X2 [Populus trichocarpa]
MANTIFIVGVLGNIISSLAYLSPLKTFWRIVKNRSTEDFSSIPYICTLMNATLWIYYGITKPDSFLIATINGFGAVTQIVYILIFLVFISPRMRAKTALLVGLLDVGFPAAAISFTHFMFQGDVRIDVVGFICDCSGMLVYASPLAAMKTVITTKSVEFMPFLLSFAILLNGGFWTLYALLAKDILVGDLARVAWAKIGPRELRQKRARLQNTSIKQGRKSTLMIRWCWVEGSSPNG